MLSFDIDNELKNVDTSKKPVNSYGIIKEVDDDDYQPSSFLQKGYFDENGELVYGIERTEFLWHGSTPFYSEKRGSFKSKNFIYIDFYYASYESRNYINENEYLYLLNNPNFKYNYYMTCEIKDSYIYKYLSDNGNLFLKQNITEDEFNKLEYNSDSGSFSSANSVDYRFSEASSIVTAKTFNAALYDENENEIYNGEIELIDIANDDIPIYCAKNYSADNGIIYSPARFICYKGNVLNGLPNGKGELYKGNDYTLTDIGEDYKIYSIDKITIEKKVNPNLIYSGNFKDGVYHGKGTTYNYGVVSSRGTWNYGKKDGYFTQYDDLSGVYVSFEGTYKDDQKDGYIVIYEPKGYLYYEGIYKHIEEYYGKEGFTKQYELLYMPDENIHKVYLWIDSVRRYKDNNLDELKIYYNPDGSIAEKEHFINGILQKD